MPQKMLSLLWPGTAEGGGHWGGGSQGRRGLARPEPSMAALPFVHSTFPFSSPVSSAPILSSAVFFSLRSALPLCSSREDLAGRYWGADAYYTKELNQLRFSAFSSSLLWLI